MRRAILVALLVLLILALPGWFVYQQVRGWQHFRAGEAALEREDFRAGWQHLEASIRVWPGSGQVRFLAARAARRAGEWDQASRRLDEAAERGWVAEAIDLERALLRAQAGELPAVENYLRYCLKNDHPDAVLILEVLTPLYLQRFDLASGMHCVDRWLEQRQQSATAWRYRALLTEKNQMRAAAVEAYRKVLALGSAGPGDQENLARLLLLMNKPTEARPLLEDLVREAPNDLSPRLLLAKCYHSQGQGEQARVLLAGILRAAPNDTEALHLLGRLELEAGQTSRAADLLRQAARQKPFDREVLYTCVQCLRAAELTEEAGRYEERLKKVEADLARVADLAKQVMARPDDPDLRREIGEIYLRNAQDEQGLRWLNSALTSRPNHSPTHLSLARYYESKGDLGRASYHRQAAKGSRPGPR